LTMDYSKLVVVVSVLVAFFAQSLKENLVKSDHSHFLPLTSPPRSAFRYTNRMVSRPNFSL